MDRACVGWQASFILRARRLVLLTPAQQVRSRRRGPHPALPPHRGRGLRALSQSADAVRQDALCDAQIVLGQGVGEPGFALQLVLMMRSETLCAPHPPRRAPCRRSAAVVTARRCDARQLVFCAGTHARQQPASTAHTCAKLKQQEAYRLSLANVGLPA
jgi:hypothetical protein